jgi:hypothetical protein
LSKTQILIYNYFEIIYNLKNIKVSTDECFKHSFSSIRARITQLEPIENLELLYISNHIHNNEGKAQAQAHAILAILAELDGSSVLVSEVPQANANANANANADANAIANANANANAKANANANALETSHATYFKSVKYSIHIYKHVEHVFHSIQAILADLEAYQIVTNKAKAKAKYDTDSFFFNFSLLTQFIEVSYDLAFQIMVRAMAMSYVIFLVSGGKVKIKINITNKNFFDIIKSTYKDEFNSRGIRKTGLRIKKRKVVLAHQKLMRTILLIICLGDFLLNLTTHHVQRYSLVIGI